MEVCLAVRPELAMRSGLPSRLTSPVIRQCVPRISSSTVRYFHGPASGLSGHSNQNTVLLEPIKSWSPSPSTSIRQLWMQALRGLLRESPGRKSCRVWAFQSGAVKSTTLPSSEAMTSIFPSAFQSAATAELIMPLASVTTCFFHSAWAKVERSGKRNSSLRMVKRGQRRAKSSLAITA